ncbi:hypothetical protein O181_022356 [Austropuccinia psidii MF-1]|uniref:RNase H type-1 domain-containing protein n=1 Tax=Austropuccinia psidii MF-1 TaxID=1389203 RepID=A0A9Q3CCP6_9BASI|nr:hypothetical protein [Austropuccinia psidii MF-1]
MSPSPARSKPPPTHLESLMNPAPDPPDDNDHMIIPEIYESEPGFLTQMHNEDQSNILTIILQKIESLERRETNLTLPTAITTLITRLNDRIENIEKRQTKMEKIIEDLLNKTEVNNKSQQKTNDIVSTPSHRNPNLETHPISFAAMAAKTPTTGPTLPKRPPPEMCQTQPQEHNKFKKYHIVIRTKFGAPKPFEKTSPQTACNTINKALMEINANYDNTPIRIRAFSRYPSGDIKLYTRSRAEARWLLENRARWTHLADPLFVMSPPTFPVIIHSCPTYVDVDDEICRNSILQQNEIKKEQVERIRWLGHPKEEEKSHGSLVIYFTDKNLAHQILRGGLIFDGNFMRTMIYSPGPPQCFNCLKTGHQAFQCKGDPTCSKCGDKHRPQDCKDPGYAPSIRSTVTQPSAKNAPSDKKKSKPSFNHLKLMTNNTPMENFTRQPNHKEEFPLGNNSNIFQNHSQSDITLFQLNCHNRYDTTFSVLNSELTHTALLLQEPWINQHNGLPPTHQAWHRITPITNPRNKNNKPRACIYISKRIPAHHIVNHIQENNLLTAITLTEVSDSTPQVTLLSLYNPPSTFEGLNLLDQWLQNESTRQTPTFIMMDSNLHHPHWNPSGYTHTHTQARYLIKSCGKKGFRLISPRHTPTFLGSVGKPTTIDLTWANHTSRLLHPTTQVQLNNHSSDHHPIITRITILQSPPQPPSKHLSMHLSRLNSSLFLDQVRQYLPTTATPLETSSADWAEENAQRLLTAITTAYNNQGKWVTTNPARSKAWWDKSQLNELVKLQNKARREMLRHQTIETKNKYYHHQQRFKQKVWELKSNHWRKFLAERGPDHAYCAYKFTRDRQIGEITPLKDNDGNLTSDIKTKASLLFHGTSLTETLASLHDIPSQQPPRLPPEFPPITEDEILGTISTLPNKKAPGPDGIPNELIKTAETLLTPHLTHLFNACLKQGRFPTQWKGSNTAIIRKAAKDDYTNPNAYRPIALLNTLGKLFEKIINTRLNHWAHISKTIHPGHVGGRPSRSINDALVTLTSWIHHKWREGKIVMGMFLDVRSAYPSVQKKRLIHTLEQKQCPPYLRYIIDSFLSDRTTRLKIDQFTSQDFQIPNGLPQGSPLSVTLYLLYNSSLLLPTPPSLNENNISIAYINDVVHLLATNTFQQGQAKIEETMARSKRWAVRHGAVFDEKKTNLMIFTKKKQTIKEITIAGTTYVLQKEVKWLGITLTPTLTPTRHIQIVKAKARTTLNQLGRIIRPTFGLCQREARILVAAVLTTRILHGSIIWYTEKNRKTVERLLTAVFFQATRLCTGMMKQTPSPFLKLYGGIKDLTKQHIKLTHNYIHSKLTAPIDDAYQTLVWREITSTPSTHLSPLNNLLERNTLLEQHSTRAETLSPFPIPPWSTKLTNVINLGLTKEMAKEKVLEQMKTELSEHSLVFFTDGSLIPGKGGGAAAILVNTQRSTSTYVGKNSNTTSFETELMALHLLQDLLLEHIKNLGPPPAIAIFSDSQAALKSTILPKKNSPGQMITSKIFNDLKRWSQLFPVRLYWCPGHLDIHENEMADKLAKTAANTGITSSYTLHHVSISKLKQITKQKSREPPPLSNIELARINFKTSPKLIIQSLDQLEKGLAATIHQLRSEHAPLNAYLHRIRQKDSPLCPHCNTLETTSHYLIACKQFQQPRTELKKKIRKHRLRLNPNSHTSLLDNPYVFPLLADYIISTARFRHIRNYIPPNPKPPP